MTGVFRIRLTDLRFFSRIGVFEQERKVGNEFRLNLEVEIDASGFREEDLSTSLSYAEIYQEVKGIMTKEWLLLETVSVRIAEVLKQRWPSILSGTVRIEKLTPPIAGIDGHCGIDYRF